MVIRVASPLLALSATLIALLACGGRFTRDDEGSGGVSGQSGADAGVAGTAGGGAASGAGGAGGAPSCGALGQSCCSGQACGNDSLACVEGQCIACPLTCDGQCVDPATDADHCGGCDRICPKSCGSGVCVPAIADFSLGSKHTCVTLGDASVYCWGHNGNGQLGQPDPTTHYTPHAVDGLAALQVAVGDFSNCALSTDGLVYCWGNSLTWPVPTALPSFGGVAQLTLGAHHTCALLMDGTVSCFGSNVHAQLGRGEPTPTDSPDPAPVWDLDGVVQVVAGSRHTCARLVGGSVKCWGDNEFLQAGSAVDSPVRKPLLVPGVSDAVHIGAGARHTCAVSKAGTLTCWGYGQDSQLGSFQLGGSEPILVDGLTGVRVVAGGDRHTCALLADETVKCWGRGYLGDGKEQWETPTPQSVVGLSGVERIEAGEGHTCALNGHGTLYCWGEGDYGQLGTGASSAALSPEPVAW